MILLEYVNVFNAEKIYQVEALRSAIMAAAWQSREQLCAKHSKNPAGGIATYKHDFHFSSVRKKLFRKSSITD